MRNKCLVILLFILIVFVGSTNSPYVEKYVAKTVTMDILKDEKNPSSQAEIKFVNNKITETLEESEENKANTNYNNTEYMKYPVSSTFFCQQNQYGYELVISQASEEQGSDRDVKVFVSQLNGTVYELKQVLTDTFHEGESWNPKGLYLIDVDFDGKNDILVQNGHFGNQGLINYTCYLNRDGEYVLCKSFTEIPNVAVNEKNKVILGCWRNYAVSHSYAMYSFIKDEFVMTHRLTEEPVNSSYTNESDILWGWTVETLVDGVMQVTEKFSEKYVDDKSVENKLYGENSFWGLDQDKWNTLNNGGKMWDFSIYNS